MFGSAVPWLLIVQVSPVQPVMNVGTGALLPGGSTIVTLCAAEVLVSVHSSRTVSVTWNGAPTGLGAVKVLVGSGPLPLVVDP